MNRYFMLMLALLLAFVSPLPSHIDHGVGGERIRFEPPPEATKPTARRDRILSFKPTPRLNGILKSTDFSAGLTVSGWIRRTSPSASDPVITQWGHFNLGKFALSAGSGLGEGFQLRWSDGSVSGVVGYEIPVDEWTHCVGVFDGDSMSVYVNGVSVATEAVNGKRLGSFEDSVTIGNSVLGDVSASGAIDDVGVWNRSLSKTEIVQLYAGIVPGGTVGWWTIEDTDTRPSVDSRVRFEKDSERRGRVLRLVSDPPIDTGLQLAGSGAFSVTAWVYNRGTDRLGGPVVGQWGEDPLDRSLVLYSVGGDGFGFRAYWEDGTQNNLTVVDTPAESWFHYAATYDGREMRLYVNGAAMGRTIAVDKRLANTGRPLVIGGIDESGRVPFRGYLDDVAIWKRALTDEEIETAVRGRHVMDLVDRVYTNDFNDSGSETVGADIPRPVFEEAAAGGIDLAPWLDAARNDTIRLTRGFWWASLHNRHESMAALLGLGADIDALLGFGGHTALHAAVTDRRVQTVQFLVDHGADVNLKDRMFGSPAWGWAGHFGYAVLKSYLLDAASESDLFAAIEYDAPDRAARLIGSDKSWDLDRALRSSAAFGRPEIIQALLEAGADPDERDGGGRRAEDLAVRRSRYGSVDVLRRWRGLDVSGPLSFAERVALLDRAIEAGETAVVDSVIQVDPPIVLADPAEDRSWIQRAADVNHPGIARRLIDAGAPWDRVRNHHRALSWAVTVGADDVAEVILDAGEELDLFTAAGLGRTTEMERFFEADSLIDASSTTGSTRLDENREVMQKPPLLAEKRLADALYIASRNGRAGAVAYLLEKGADPDFRAERGGTSLYWATKAGHVEVVQLLIEAGADPSIPDRYGQNARQIALRSQNEKLRSLLAKDQ